MILETCIELEKIEKDLTRLVYRMASCDYNASQKNIRSGIEHIQAGITNIYDNRQKTRLTQNVTEKINKEKNHD